MARRVPIGRVARNAVHGRSTGLAPALAGYTPGQRRVIRALDREADTRGLTGRRGRAIRLSAYMTGLTESNLLNLGHGDGSSVNWRQETAESYGNVDRMNLRGSVGRYFDEAEAAYHKGVKPGELAQSVQRSAYPDRYAQQRGQALDLLAATRRVNWKGGVPGHAGGAGGQLVGASGPSIDREAVQPEGGISALVQALAASERPAPVGGSPLAPPSFAAAAAMPSGYQGVASGGGPAPPKPDISELMALVQPGSGTPESTFTPGQVGSMQGGGGGAHRGAGGPAGSGLPNYGPSGGRNVSVSGAPIDRPGVSTHRYVLDAVDAISDILGSPIQLGTGTAHDQMTVNGNVSQHWSGGAIDLPSSGKRLRAIGRSALIAAGMDPRRARKAPGGLYNINGWQIIFDTDEGGDHRDHAHVAPPKGWRRPRSWR